MKYFLRLANQKSIILLILFLHTTSAEAQTKKADLAGSWYPDSKEELLSQLNGYLNKAEPVKIDGKVIGIISPHAGYIYSGPVAAYGFKLIKRMDIRTAIIIGFNHRLYHDGIAVFDGEGYQTPLGAIPIAQDLTKALMNQDKNIYNYPQAFEGENSIEMQIPFLQVVLKDFKLVLVAIGDQNPENYQLIAKALYNVLKDKDRFLLIASTDMAHFLTYKETNKIDNSTISIIREFDPDKLYTESLLQNHRLMCGYGAVCATMLAAELLGADKLEVLKYANSGDTAGDKRRVVGYLSAVMYEENHPPSPKASADVRRRLSTLRNPIHEGGQKSKIKNQEGEKQMLSEKQRKRLLQIARETMEAYIKTGKRLEFKEDDPTLNREMGAFVTLHYKGQLRGCIGNIIGRGPLYLTVRDMAIESSTDDPRFPPVTAPELKDIDIEISVLSELQKIEDPGIIEMGRHGVLIRSGFRSGVFLPQVAMETGWSREEFMSNLCSHKAGLPPDAWKKGGCEIYIFTAEVFGEK